MIKSSGFCCWYWDERTITWLLVSLTIDSGLPSFFTEGMMSADSEFWEMVV
jgi:hypothetical protein